MRENGARLVAQEEACSARFPLKATWESSHFDHELRNNAGSKGLVAGLGSRRAVDGGLECLSCTSASGGVESYGWHPPVWSLRDTTAG